MVQCRMRKTPAAAIPWLLLLVMALPVSAQRERIADQSQSEQKFFEQLRNLFGRFRDGDLQRAFEMAGPIRCSDLVSGSGEWRSVAFFNEDRKLGDWYHSSLEEVKGDLSTYIFQGPCASEEGPVQLVTKFPVKDSLDRYYDGRIHFNEIKINVNPAVRAAFDSRSQAYRFELPYLYSVKGKPGEIVYSLFADRASDRYVTNVTNQWECKFVHANDVTFQFLICDTWTVPRDVDPRNRGRQSFGSAAYFILSDGKEATTSMKLSFGDGTEEKAPEPADVDTADRTTADRTTREAPDDQPLASWQIPASSLKLFEVDDGEFRVRFSPQTWANKIGSAQVLSDQKMSNLDPGKLPAGVDYCAWRPASASLAPRVLGSEPDADVAYSLAIADTSISFEMKTHNGSRIGALQCFFPGEKSMESVPVERWVNVVGGHLTIEVLP